MNDQLWRVEAPHFVAGIVVAQNGAIVNAAPILNWSCDRPFAWFKDYCARKGWKLERYSEGDYYSLMRKVVQNV